MDDKDFLLNERKSILVYIQDLKNHLSHLEKRKEELDKLLDYVAADNI